MSAVRAFTLVVGAVLVVVGVLAYAVSGTSSLTAFIPSLVGALLLVCGLLAGREALRRHAMHAAAVIALLGFLGASMNALRIGEVLAGTAQRPAAVISSFVMAVLLLAYLIVAVRSFVRARRERLGSR
jgi:hypothetical protein